KSFQILGAQMFGAKIPGDERQMTSDDDAAAERASAAPRRPGDDNVNHAGFFAVLRALGFGAGGAAAAASAAAASLARRSARRRAMFSRTALASARYSFMAATPSAACAFFLNSASARSRTLD